MGQKGMKWKPKTADLSYLGSKDQIKTLAEPITVSSVELNPSWYGTFNERRRCMTEQRGGNEVFILCRL